jgi:hypothetical protein
VAPVLRVEGDAQEAALAVGADPGPEVEEGAASILPPAKMRTSPVFSTTNIRARPSRAEVTWVGWDRPAARAVNVTVGAAGPGRR